MRKNILFPLLMAVSCAAYAQTAAPAAQPGPAPAAAVKVEKIVNASAVEKREPVGEAVSFAAGKVYTWTKVTSENVPARIKHVYYKEGKKAAEIELAVNTSPCRTWSAKTVTPGSWKVEVTDEAGNVLTSAEFTVTGAAAEAAPQEAPAQQAKP